MYYDQLLALKDRLKVLYINVLNHSYLEDSDKKLLLVEIGKRIQEIKKRLIQAKGYHYSCAKSYDEARNFKKVIKNEFLLQAKDGYPVSDIVDFIEENFSNPGINLEKYITGLREKGYFYYRDIEEQDSSLIITSKTERYLENEANVSLKR